MIRLPGRLVAAVAAMALLAYAVLLRGLGGAHELLGPRTATAAVAVLPFGLAVVALWMRQKIAADLGTPRFLRRTISVGLAFVGLALLAISAVFLWKALEGG